MSEAELQAYDREIIRRRKEFNASTGLALRTTILEFFVHTQGIRNDLECRPEPVEGSQSGP